MNTMIFSLREWSVGAKLAVAYFILTAAVFSIFTLLIGNHTAQIMETEAIDEVQQKTKLVTDLIETINIGLQLEVGIKAEIFKAYFVDTISLDPTRTADIGEIQVPLLKHGESEINLDFTFADKFTKLTGATATVFVKSGADFVSISTSQKKGDGSRAVGTALDRNNPAYSRLLAGESYVGMATLFGKQFITKYDPIKGPMVRLSGRFTLAPISVFR